MQDKCVGTCFMVNEHPIVGDACYMTFPFAGKIAGERVIFKQFGRWNVNCELVNDLYERRQIPMSAIKQFNASLKFRCRDFCSHFRQSEIMSSVFAYRFIGISPRSI